MAPSISQKASLSHDERTIQEPRAPTLEPITITKIHTINPTIRLYHLSSVLKTHKLQFQPGQWLDVFIPSLPKPGGFTITSTPEDQGRPTPERAAYFELAVQRSTNPPAQWLWKPESEVLGQELKVRVGGSFVWPPKGKGMEGRVWEQVLLGAGGVGINPLISMFASMLAMPATTRPKKVTFLYGTKISQNPINASEILFLTRLNDLIKSHTNYDIQLQLFLTNTSEDEIRKAKDLPDTVKLGRIAKQDLEAAVGGDEKVRKGTVAFVCGPPAMTDEFVEFLGTREGLDRERVFCEKWW